MSEVDPIRRVMLTGASGFVGRHMLRELLAGGYTPICLARSDRKLDRVLGQLDRRRIEVVSGSLFDRHAVRDAAERSDACIHLVGVIMERRMAGQTFDRVHRVGTMNVVDALLAAGRRRYVHMSALGSRPDAVSRYHQTKWAAEEYVRRSTLDWTIFRPSVIHGPDGEFMELMRTFACGLIPPVRPYFGSGENRLQPVSVRDVAFCFVESLRRPETIGKAFDLGGPETYSWKELYDTCSRLIPGAKRWKPLAAQPVPIAKLLAMTVMKTPLVPRKLKFNVDQVQMSQEDSVCDIQPVKDAFAIGLRRFEDELRTYADVIGAVS